MLALYLQFMKQIETTTRLLDILLTLFTIIKMFLVIGKKLAETLFLNSILEVTIETNEF
jgi:hypothetical protein